MRHNLNSGLIVWMCISLIGSTLPVNVAQAESVSSGTGGSITIEPTDLDGKPVADSFRYGQQVRLKISAHDVNGNTVPCQNPTYTTEQGVAGQQIAGVDQATGIMTMGQSFGQAAVQVHCENLPNVKAEMHVYNSKTMTPPTIGKPGLMAPVEAPAVQTAPPAAAAGGDMLLPLVLAGGAGLLLVKALSSSSAPCDASAGELWCRTPNKCCPAGKPYYCNNNAIGCYASNPSGACTVTWCTSEY